ncbi:MAG: aspartate-semialdehyde dehydrogenase [Christensenellaceae bacterium]|jgi:aspartate-semialdehyde dehydrogenase|nr:aspartate-semialdehyde dehydrogenase [Christensenellaceae bacterium]
MSKIKIAVVGCSGLVGSTMLKVLKERGVDADLVCIKKLSLQIIRDTRPDYALMAVSADLSKIWTPVFVKYGTVVIDNSSHFRQNPKVPLIVPEVNADQIKSAKIIANPNCSTIQSVIPLSLLNKDNKIKKIIYNTYQAKSGAGAETLREFIKKPDFNVIPFIQDEEEKMINETKKILNDFNLEIYATCVRVPVRNCHLVSIYVEFESIIDFEKIKTLLNPRKMITPVEADGFDEIFVCRLRQNNDRSISFITVADNLRKGAATNAVQILQGILRNKHKGIDDGGK